MKIIVEDSDLHGIVKIIKLYQNGFSSLWRYTITHLIRRIHDKQYFNSTELVYKTIGIDKMNKSDRQKWNRENKFDSLMIEHLITVKTIVNKLSNLTLKNDDKESIQLVRNIIEENTKCVVKFRTKEKHLVGK
jgi:hypothetical protein